MSNISYSAVVLDDKSRDRLINMFKKQIPDDWEIVSHHQIINLGEIDPEYEKYLGFPVRLKVDDFAMDDKVAAVGVSGFPSKDRKPHIILAVNAKDGGKLRMSKELMDWKPFNKNLFLRGNVEEIPLNFNDN